MTKNIPDTLQHIVESGTAGVVKGKIVDSFTASMILTVAEKLTPVNQRELYRRPINEIVAVTYKILTS
jgi:hypothetical protein